MIKARAWALYYGSLFTPPKPDKVLRKLERKRKFLEERMQQRRSGFSCVLEQLKTRGVKKDRFHKRQNDVAKLGKHGFLDEHFQ